MYYLFFGNFLSVDSVMSHIPLQCQQFLLESYFQSKYVFKVDHMSLIEMAVDCMYLGLGLCAA
jgi:hypothetical protein